MLRRAEVNLGIGPYDEPLVTGFWSKSGLEKIDVRPVRTELFDDAVLCLAGSVLSSETV